MKQEEKSILFKDLSSRLPYEVLVVNDKDHEHMFPLSGDMLELMYPGVVKKEEWDLFPYTINIDSFYDFEKLENAYKSNLIISFTRRTIEIYDDYAE